MRSILVTMYKIFNAEIKIRTTETNLIIMTTESNSHFKALCIGHFAMGTITSTLTVRICISPENKTKKKKE